MTKSITVTLLMLGTLAWSTDGGPADYGPRDLMWDVYAARIANQDVTPGEKAAFTAVLSLDGADKHRKLDALLFMYEKGRLFPADELARLVEKGTVPVAENKRIYRHLRMIYEARNEALDQVFADKGANDVSAVFFLNLADRMDGRLDGILGVPDWDSLYDLLVVKRVPPAAVGYNFRDYQTWVDRRSVFRLDRLESELPNSIRRLRSSNMADERKLKRILRYVNRLVEAAEDGFQTDYWQTPEETLLVGEGDCEDFAILFHVIADYAGVPTKVVIGYTWQMNEFNEPERDGHAWIEYRGETLDPIRPKSDYSRYQPLIRIDAETAQFVDQGSKRVAARAMSLR